MQVNLRLLQFGVRDYRDHQQSEMFSGWFNEKYPEAYRRISTEDVKDMTVSGLITGMGTTAEK